MATLRNCDGICFRIFTLWLWPNKKFPDFSLIFLKFQFSLTWYQNSLTFPWRLPGMEFPWLFPDRWTPWLVLSNTLSLSPIRHILRNVYTVYAFSYILSLIARFMGPAWGPSGADRTQVGPMLATWTLLSGVVYHQSILPLRVSDNYHMIAQVRFFFAT